MTTGERTLGARRRWLALSVATLVATVSYWAILIAFASSDQSPAELSLGSLALGLVIVPFVFLALAIVSAHPAVPMAALGGLGLFLLFAPPIALFFDPVTGLVSGFGAGAVVAMRLEEVHSRRSRAVAVTLAVVSTVAGLLVFPPVAVAFGPALPFVAIGSADVWREGRVPS
jgi:Na+/glutamate symporter